jgi:pantoate--beta-alanine ligase
MQETSKRHLLKSRSIGFVPTMGALHDGHLFLVRRARSENDIVVASIFVNPAQFGQNEDFENYPRDVEGDVAKLKKEDVDILFMPDTISMYPAGFSTSVEVDGLSEKLCGAFRIGHFKGVTTVVSKLFNIVLPTRAYFGQKDYQQALIIKKMIDDLNICVEQVICATVREDDGLAMSSRNQYLKPAERQAAPVIYRALKSAAQLVGSGNSTPAQIRTLINEMLKKEPLVSEIQYAGIYDPDTLDELTEIRKNNLLAIAVKIGTTRLIDNLLVEHKQK